jgi:C-methyltransferase C-terminal domain
VGELLCMERTLGISEFATFQRFARQTLQLKEDLQRTLRDLQHQGRRVVGYGAPAKGSTLLSFLEITPDLMGYIVDRSPLKQGRYTPGTHIPVVSPQRLLTDQPDYVVLLAWNFVDEILAQQNEYRSRGGKFIVPVPHVQIV